MLTRILFFRKSNAELPLTSSLDLSCSNYDGGGELPAAVYVGTVTHSRVSYMQRLSLARKLSGDADAYQPTSASLYFLL